ncbi:MAG: WD40/YVTN/BNR-like repeat-containing protein [Chthonomonadales bacterium]
MHRAFFGQYKPIRWRSVSHQSGLAVFLSVIGGVSHGQVPATSAQHPVPAAVAGRHLDLNSVSQVEAYVRQLRKQSPARPGAIQRPGGGGSGGGGGIPNIPLRFWDAYLYYIKQRAFPNDHVNWQAYSRAARQRDALPAAKPPRVPTGRNSKPGAGGVRLQGMTQPPPSLWEFVGPVGMTHPSGVWGIGPSYISGRVNAVAYAPIMPDPVDTSGILWLGAAGGGLWKSVDAGTTWVPLGDQWPTLNVSAIAVDPTDYNTVYVGTGDFHGFGGYGQGS